jgi:hypothetical protein
MRKQCTIYLATALALNCACAGRAGADVLVSGSSDRFVLQTKDANLADVLSALQSAFHIEVKVKGSTAQKFTGIYSGSLRRVLSRLLKGTNYIVSASTRELQIVIVSANNAKPALLRPDPADDLSVDNDPALKALAAAAAGHVGSRTSRIRQQRAIMGAPQAPDVY